MLRTLLVDMNPDISHVPLSLASVSWWGVLGVEGCPVHVKEENLNFLKPLHTCERVPPLIELTARYLHSMFKGMEDSLSFEGMEPTTLGPASHCL